MVLWINCSPCKQGFEVIKLQYSLRLKIKRKDWLFYFESENELKFNKLKARVVGSIPGFMSRSDETLSRGFVSI